jgi:hypothetical protein
VSGSFVLSSGVPYTGLVVSGSILTRRYPSLSVGQSSVVTFQALLSTGIQAASTTVNNIGTAVWTSLSGTFVSG